MTASPTSAVDVEKSVFDVGIHERLPVPQLAILAIQNIFGMTGMFVFPGIFGRAFQMPLDQIAYIFGMTFVVSGLITVFQSVVFLRLPIVQGPFVGTFIGLLVLGHIPGVGLATSFGSFFIASIIWAALSIPIRGLSFIALFGKLFQTPLISGVMVILLMIQIAVVSLPNWIGQPQSPGFYAVNLLSGFIAVVVFVAMTLAGGIWLRRSAILSALLLGTLGYSLFVPISLAPVASAPWLVTPHLFPFGFDYRLDAVFLFLVVLVPTSITYMALYQVVADWGHEQMTSVRMSEGVFSAALGSILAAMVGTFSTTVYPDNMGMLRSTRVGSRYATFAAGILLVVLGCCTKFDMLLVLVPVVVLGGVGTLLFGIVMVHGVHLLSGIEWDDRNLVIAGGALMIGLGGLLVEPETAKALPLTMQILLKQPAVTGGLTVLILYALLGKRQPAPAS